MRIISGKYKGKQIKAPETLPVRPTTDYAKSGLFNMLASRYNFINLEVADLFSGTGSITYEFLSRGCEQIVSVDHHPSCIKFIRDTLTLLKAPPRVLAVKADALQWLKNTKDNFDVIVADAPFDETPAEQLVEIVFQKNMLKKGGLLIIEHSSSNDLSKLPCFSEHRKYGHVSFSFFKAEVTADVK